MKNLIFLLILIVPLILNQKLAAQPDHYVINGLIEGAEGVKFILQSNSSGKVVTIDSAVVVNGKFSMFKGSAKYPELDRLFAPVPSRGVTFFVENSIITITGRLDSLDKVKITGSKSQNDYEVFQKAAKPISDKMTKLGNEFKAASDALEKEMMNAQKDFVKNNPRSFVAPMILRMAQRDMKPEEMEALVNGLDPEVAKTPAIMDIKARLTAKKSIFIGGKAPDFTLNDPNGKPVSLSSKIGPKLLLIDFWAGWCAPCRQENPNVLKVYNEYRKKGFDVIGVSLDRNRPEWVNAISTDKLPWTQVSDLNYFSSTAAALYNVEAIPANFLLDEKGIIIAMNIRGEALNNWVKGMLETGPVTDIDGNVYKTVAVGKQVWMAENLKTTKYSNGDPIPHVIDTLNWGKLTSGAYCNVRNDEKLVKTYGRMYNWHAVKDSRNIAPKGWHVATDKDWNTLISYLGGPGVSGGKLKETGTDHWLSPNNGGTNQSGLSFLPAGNRNVQGIFNILGRIGFWWTSTESSKEKATRYNITNNWPSMAKGESDKLEGFSVRCVKD